ncbi:unnamed protein product [Cyprideis torosa]|uniref:Uncharacterized protein n=1 Tax=Cyprideis torosa TaxID=163714 RepID=A0A7R8ZKM5_9CRUS|nr:unnamed protein product [Cyprideis torosa]CAG0889714.1 unnamed protein product [Cyprideis torosa]
MELPFGTPLLFHFLALVCIVQAEQDLFHNRLDTTCTSSNPILTANSVYQCTNHCLKISANSFGLCTAVMWDPNARTCQTCPQSMDVNGRPDFQDTPGKTLFVRRWKTRCQPSWDFYLETGKCYLLVETPMKWQATENHCVAYGSNTHLASLGSSGERDFLLGIRNDTWVWLGGNDLEHEAEWVNTDGTPSWMGAWDVTPSEPNNHLDNEHCQAMILETVNDKTCSFDYKFFCKGDGS